MKIEDLLHLNPETSDMLNMITTTDFDIFTIRSATKENELLTTITYLLHKHQVFSNLKISIDTFLSFIAKIQGGYRDITYHNNTHAADLSSTLYFILIEGELMTKT